MTWPDIFLLLTRQSPAACLAFHSVLPSTQRAWENEAIITVDRKIVRERRRANRRHLTGKVSLQLGDRLLEFPAADISVSGIGVMLDVAVFGPKPAGEVGFCRIESPDLPSVIEAYVSVMRIRRVGQQFLLGLRFESIEDEQLAAIRNYQTMS